MIERRWKRSIGAYLFQKVVLQRGPILIWCDGQLIGTLMKELASTLFATKGTNRFNSSGGVELATLVREERSKTNATVNPAIHGSLMLPAARRRIIALSRNLGVFSYASRTISHAGILPVANFPLPIEVTECARLLFTGCHGVDVTGTRTDRTGPNRTGPRRAYTEREPLIGRGISPISRERETTSVRESSYACNVSARKLGRDPDTVHEEAETAPIGSRIGVVASTARRKS